MLVAHWAQRDVIDKAADGPSARDLSGEWTHAVMTQAGEVLAQLSRFGRRVEFEGPSLVEVCPSLHGCCREAGVIHMVVDDEDAAG